MIDRKTAALIAVFAVGCAAYTFWPSPEKSTVASVQTDTALVSVVIPEMFSQNAQIGEKAFNANCAICHGINAAGQDAVAPPLIHKIYESSHHGDESFQRAAAQGVRAHHWPFGSMPAVEGIARSDVTLIIAYVRELQRANGIN